MATGTIARQKTTGFVKRPAYYIGDHLVLKKISLGIGLYGLIIPLKTEGDARVDEILDIMADSMADFDTVPCGTMIRIRSTVINSSIRLNNPEIDRFDTAIPLRKAECRRNYFHWSKDKHDWEILPFNLRTLKVENDNFMLIVQERRGHQQG